MFFMKHFLFMKHVKMKLHIIYTYNIILKVNIIKFTHLRAIKGQFCLKQNNYKLSFFFKVISESALYR